MAVPSGVGGCLLLLFCRFRLGFGIPRCTPVGCDRPYATWCEHACPLLFNFVHTSVQPDQGSKHASVQHDGWQRVLPVAAYACGDATATVLHGKVEL